MRMDASTLSNANDGDARRPSAFLSERQLSLCSCSLFIACVFPSLSPLSPPGPFPPSAPQSSGIFSLFTRQLLIVNNNTSHAAARRARSSCIAPPLRALSTFLFSKDEDSCRSKFKIEQNSVLFFPSETLFCNLMMMSGQKWGSGQHELSPRSSCRLLRSAPACARQALPRSTNVAIEPKVSSKAKTNHLLLAGILPTTANKPSTGHNPTTASHASQGITFPWPWPRAGRCAAES